MQFALGVINAGTQLVLLNVAREFGLDNSGIGILAAMQFGGMIPGTIFFAPLTDRMSKKKVLCIFGGIVALGTAIGIFAVNAFMVGLCIFTYGIGFAIVNGTMGAALMETAPEKSNTFTNMSQLFQSLGAVLCPVVMGALIDGGMNWRGNFAICTVLFGGATVLFGLTRYKAAQPRRPALASKDRSAAKAFGILILLMMLAQGMYVAMESGQVYFTKPYFITELADESHAALSISLIWLSMVPSRLLAARVHKHKLPLVCGCFIAAAAACLLDALVRVPAAALAASVLFGLAAGPIFPTIMSAAMDAHPAHTGWASNMLMLAAGVFGVSANIGMGALNAAIGIGNGFFVVAGFAVLGAVLFALTRRAARGRA